MAYIKTIWENLPSESTPINASNLNKIENGIYDNSVNIELANTQINQFGKLLWEGNFTSGSITVNGLNDYTIIIAIVGGAICIGDLQYGIGGAGGYGSYTTSIYNYRFGVNGNTLTIDNINRGGSDGTQNVPVTKIYGLF